VNRVHFGGGWAASDVGGFLVSLRFRNARPP
jgi:hypothetical protein